VKAVLRKFRLLALVLLTELVLAFVNPQVARSAAVNTGEFLLNILLILPMILILMGLFDAWVPRSTVERNVGPGSGARGVALSILLGTAAAGPLYAAFPIAKSMQNKGARRANITIFLSTWASVKIPMVAMEAHFVGLNFALLRLGLTVPGVILLGFLLERLHGPDKGAQTL
jgi:uncharacterized membrane protein YraQ (UPF0718 family)